MLLQTHGNPPSEEELAAYSGLRQKQIACARAVAERKYIDNFDSLTSDYEQPDEAAERSDFVAHVYSLLELLPARLCFILRRYYEDHLTMADIGRVIGRTESRVFQLHQEAIERLREMLAEEQPGPRAA